MRRLTLFGLILLVLVLAACGGDEPEKTPVPPTLTPTESLPPSPSPTPRNTPMPQPVTDSDPLTQAQLRVVHASADLPAVSLYLDGAQIGRGFTQGQFHSAPLGFQAGDYILRVVSANDNPDDIPPLLAYPLSLNAGSSRILVLIGPPENVQVIQYEEDLSALPNDTARVSVIHAVPRGAPFDLEADNLTLLSGLDFGMTGGPVPTAAGPHTYNFVSGPTTLATLNANFTERLAYTLVLIGDSDTNTYRAISFSTPTHDETPLRVIHASPILPRIDVYLGGDLIAQDMGFREASAWHIYRSLAYDLRLLPAGNPEAEPLYQARITLLPNKSLDIVLLGEAQQLRVVSVDEDLSATPPGNTRITFVNGVIGTLQITIETYGGELPDLKPISFGTASRPTLISAGRTEYLFNQAGGSQEGQADFLPERDWVAGVAYTVVVTGYLDTGPIVVETEVGTAETDTAALDQTPIPGSGRFEIRVINALPSADPVDIGFDGSPVFDAVRQGTGTPYHTFDTQPTTISLSKGSSVVFQDDLQLAEPAKLTVFVFEDQNGIRVEAVSDMPYAIPDRQAALRVLHAAPNKPDLEITRQVTGGAAETGEESAASEEGGPTPVPEEALTEAARLGIPTNLDIIPAGVYDIRIREIDTGILVLTVPDVIFESRGTYDLVILPDASGLSIIPLLIPLE